MPVNIKLANEMWARYSWLRDNGHSDYVRKASQCEDFFAGLQWDKADLQYLKENRRPALTINKIISTLSNVMGEQIFNRTDMAFRPRNEGATSEVADALTKTTMQISDNNQLPWVRSDVFADGVIGSRGFYDLRLDFSDSLRGEARIEQLNPKNVMIDSDADEYDPDKWQDVFTTKWMSLDQIELMYSAADAKILSSRANSYNPFGYDTQDQDRDRFGFSRAAYAAHTQPNEDTTMRNVRVIERQYRKLSKVKHFVTLATGDLRPIPEEWDDARVEQYLQANPNVGVMKKMVPRIRWTVVADNVVLHDDWSPYKHFTVVPYFPYFRRGRTIGLVENLIGPQELLNKVSSQELHVVNTTANSGYKVKKGAMTNMSVPELEQRGAQTGIVIEVNDMDGVDKLTPNATPSGLDRISYKAEEHIKGISGVSDYMQGTPREDVSAKAVNSNKQSGQANLAKVMDNLTRTDWMLGRNLLDMIQMFYTEERLVHITTDRVMNTTETIKVNELTPEGTIVNNLTIGEYAVVISSQPERDTFEDSQFDQAVMMRREIQVAIPDKVIIQASRLKNKAEIIKAMEGDQTSPEAQAAAALAQRGQEAQVANLEADAQLKQAKSQKELSTIGEGGAEMEMMKLEQEIALEREKMEREFELKREQLQQEMALKREQAAADTAIKQEQARADAMTNRIAAVETAKNTKPSPQGVSK